MELQNTLFSMQDLPYRAFSSKLMPTVDPKTVIGVRIPALRRLAKELSKTDYKTEFFNTLPHQYYEENNLHAFLICELRDFDECIGELDRFLPYVDNWATCDSLRPKCFAKHRGQLIQKIPQWLASKHAYTVRFGIEMLMCHFLDTYFYKDYLEWVTKIRFDDYYVNMMIAWYFATALTKQWEAVLPYIREHRLPTWIHQKTIQKAVESRCISNDKKRILRALRIQSV